MRTKIPRKTARTMEAAARTDFEDIKKRAPKSGPSGYNDEADCLERPASSEADAARTGERRSLLQEARVRGGRARIGQLAAGVGRAMDVENAAVSVAQRGRHAGADRVGIQVVTLVDVRGRLAVEHVEDVDEEVHMRTAHGDRIAGMQVGFVVRRTTAERAARGEVILPVAVRVCVTLRRQRNTRFPVRADADVETLGHTGRERV